MKELSFEKKAKRYDKAIERAKGLIDFCSDSELKTLEHVFPELKESEDEKIRKNLITFFQRFPYENLKDAGLTAKDAIAWLEKQKKEEPQIYKTRDGEVITYSENEGYKVVEGSDEDEYIIEEIEAIIDAYVLEENNPKALKDWLKSLKDRVLTQPKQEWSEEDEKKRNALIKGLQDKMGFGWASDPFSREEYIDWLKSLQFIKPTKTCNQKINKIIEWLKNNHHNYSIWNTQEYEIDFKTDELINDLKKEIYEK